MISIKKDATNVIALDVAVSKDYLLLQFVNLYKQAQRITMCAPVVVSGINTVTIIEKSGTINALNGEVYLSSLANAVVKKPQKKLYLKLLIRLLHL